MNPRPPNPKDIISRILDCNWYSDNGDVACFTDGATYTNWHPINILLIAADPPIPSTAYPVDLGDIARHNVYCLDAYTARRAADLHLKCLGNRPDRIDLIALVKDGVDNVAYVIIP